MKRISISLLTLSVLIIGALCSCQQPQNKLTAEEENDGWQLLFNGQDLTGWRAFNGKPGDYNGWHVVDGCMQASGDGSDESGYIVTEQQYADFELSWDWKLTHGGNSGMLYHVVENACYAVPYVTGPEYQLIDNDGWEEENAPTKLEEWQKLGVDYAMHLPDYSKMNVNPQGEWNTSRIIFDNGHVEHWINGEKIVEFEAWTNDWFALKGSGKWAGAPEYGLARQGVICLQDHGYPASFRNIKIRPLPHRALGEDVLFDGTNTENWEVFGGNAEVSVTEDGCLLTAKADEGETAYICTRKYYKDFDFSVDFCQTAPGNTGLFFHGFLDQNDKLHGGEVEMGPKGWNNGGVFSAEIFDKLVIVSDEVDALTREGEWNHLQLHVEGDHIVVAMNGTITADINDAAIGATPGRLMLQVGSGASVLWKNFRLSEL